MLLGEEPPILRPHWHCMHHGWAVGPIDHDQLQELRVAARAEDEVARGVLSDWFDDGGLA